MAVEKDRSLKDIVIPITPRGAVELLHAGVFGICALAVYATHAEGPIDWAETHPNGNPVLAAVIALMVLIPVIGFRAQLAVRPLGKLVLALGLAYTFRLAFTPLMPNDLLRGAAETYQLSWANVALLVLVIGWLAALLSRRRSSPVFTDLEAPVAVGALGLCGLSVALLLAVGESYDADPGYTVALFIKIAQYGLICVAATTVSGTRRIGAWLHLYVLVALVSAVALSMLAAGEPMDAHLSTWGVSA